MIRIKQDKQYLSYILEDNSKFFPTGYRVMKKQKEKGIISCSKVIFNGQIKLLYPVGERESIFSASEYWELKEVYAWMLRLIKVVMEVQENGFLRVEDIDVNLSRIFIDEENKQVYLVVLPLTSDAEFIPNWNKEFEKALISMIGLARVRNDMALTQTKQLIQDNSSSLEILYRKLKMMAVDMALEPDTSNLKKDEELPGGILHLKTRTSQKKIDIVINKEVFVLGKHPKMSDFAIDITPTISRQHCQIIKENGGYYIEDLNSKNYTYVDGEKLSAGQRVLIKKDTMIRLAEVEFCVEFVN